MRNIQLSKRLKYVSDFITPGYILADIGTDHGFIPISMVLQGKTPRAYAMDINKGPLARADEHIGEAGLSDKIETRLSDGLAKLKANVAVSVLIAGMGGSLIIKILSEGKHALTGVRELILSPHTEVDLVREFLRTTDFVIEREGMVMDAGKYYVVLKARRRNDHEKQGTLYSEDHQPVVPDSIDAALYEEICVKYGMLLLQEKNQVLADFLEKEKHKYNVILESLAESENDAGIKRRTEVEQVLRHIDIALNI